MGPGRPSLAAGRSSTPRCVLPSLRSILYELAQQQSDRVSTVFLVSGLRPQEQDAPAVHTVQLVDAEQLDGAVGP